MATKPTKSDHPHIRLNERDRQIIKVVNECRVLQTRHIQTLFFNSAKPAYGRLKLLYEAGFLERHYMPQIALAPAASQIVYSITKLGAAVLVNNFGLTEKEIHIPTKRFLNWESLDHLMHINTFRVALTRAVSNQGYILGDWMDEFEFRAKPDYVYVKDRQGREQRTPVYPDGYLSLRTPKIEARFFIEMDKSTEGHTQFKGQIDIYQEYLRSGRYQERFKTKIVLILVIAKSQKRMKNLYKTIEAAGGKGSYLLTTFDQVTPETVLSASIWYRVGGTQPTSLIPP